MFAHAYQTGPQGVELLAPSGRGPSATVNRTYDRGIKGYLFSVDTVSAEGSIICPPSTRDSLGVIQPLFVIQIQTKPSDKVAIEIVVLDNHRLRHRLFFSTSFSRPEANQLHAQLPWCWDTTDGDSTGWKSVVINMHDLTRTFFGMTVFFNSLDSFKVYGTCRVRKVFTLPLTTLTADGVKIPTIFDFPVGVPSSVCFYSISPPKPLQPPAVRPTQIPFDGISVTGTVIGRKKAAEQSLDPVAEVEPSTKNTSTRNFRAAAQEPKGNHKVNRKIDKEKVAYERFTKQEMIENNTVRETVFLAAGGVNVPQSPRLAALQSRLTLAEQHLRRAEQTYREDVS